MNPRRRFLRHGSALLATALGATALGSLRPARAAEYRALVCLFQYGGNDGINTVVPRDAERHAQYAAVRQRLALAASDLVPLDGSDYGLHPALAALQASWDAGELAPVFNVGPLNRPLSKAQLRAEPPGSPLVPQGLFSHSDQQIQWEAASSTSLQPTGWGGRAAATLALAHPVISLGGGSRFGIEPLRTPLVLPGPGEYFGAYGLSPDELTWAPAALRKQALDALYGEPQALHLGEAFRSQQLEAFDLSARLADIIAAQPGSALSGSAIDAAFAPLVQGGLVQGGLARQLYQIAKLIAQRGALGGERQLFLATQGGYDTHHGQIAGDPRQGVHAQLLRELGDAVAAFQRAMHNLGMADDVVLFTQSDFGRTFAPNATDGTDHGWGNHHLVVGGAVAGARSYGRFPVLEPGGPDDVGVEPWEQQGRWLPGHGVDQYAATLLRWFGASEGELDAILPNLANFGSARGLGFL